MSTLPIPSFIRLVYCELTPSFVGTHWFDLKTVLGGDQAI